MASCFPLRFHWWWRFCRYRYLDCLWWWPSCSTNSHRRRMHCWRRMPILHFHQGRNELRWRPSRCCNRFRRRNRQCLRCMQVWPSQRLPTRRQISVSTITRMFPLKLAVILTAASSSESTLYMGLGHNSRESSGWPISTWHAVGLIVILTLFKNTFHFDLCRDQIHKILNLKS